MPYFRNKISIFASKYHVTEYENKCYNHDLQSPQTINKKLRAHNQSCPFKITGDKHLIWSHLVVKLERIDYLCKRYGRENNKRSIAER